MHGQQSITNDQWMWVCAHTKVFLIRCAKGRAVGVTNHHQDAWFTRLLSHIRQWHTKICHGSLWWLVHPQWVLIPQKSETTCTWNTNEHKPGLDTARKQRSVFFFLPFVLVGAKEGRLRRRGGEKGSICLWKEVCKNLPFNAVSTLRAPVGT